MNEGGPKPSPQEDPKEKIKKQYIFLAKELVNSPEAHKFPGIDPEWYAKLRAVDEEFPGYSTPTDEILARMKEYGFKILLSTSDPNSGNVFVLPFNSNDTKDSLLPKHLLIKSGMDERLKKLIQLDRGDY